MAAISILKLKKQISKLISNVDKDQGQALDILKILYDVDISYDILDSTHIGMTVNEFRKCSTDEKVKSLSKNLLKKWRKQFADTAITRGKHFKNSNAEISETVKAVFIADEKIENMKTPQPIAKPSKKLHSKSRYVMMNDDDIRSKCRSMLRDALGVDKKFYAQTTKQLANELEECIFCVFRNTGRLYKNRVRSRIFNLMDPKNPNLRMRFVSGSISPARMAVLTHEEMANDEMKNLRASYRKQGIDKCRLAIVKGTSSDLLQCGKCKKRDCCYNQAQTRSADEPMTTFVLCNNCGNRWKC